MPDALRWPGDWCLALLIREGWRRLARLSFLIAGPASTRHPRTPLGPQLKDIESRRPSATEALRAACASLRDQLLQLTRLEAGEQLWSLILAY